MNKDFLASLYKQSGTGNELEDLKRAICQNIQLILQSRQSPVAESEKQLLSHPALFGYGLSTHYFGRGDYQSNRLCRDIEQLLSVYEPRIKQVLVEVVRQQSQGNRLCFRIEGVIPTHQEKQGVPVVFNSELNLSNTQLHIEENSFV